MDPTEFKRASRAVWDAMAQGWDDRRAYFEESARPVAERMLELLAPMPGQEILELAAGTGVVGFAAADLVGPTGHVLVSDFSEAMVEAARRRAAELRILNVDCRVLDAERIDLPDASVDGVLCRWGYMLMPDPEEAFAETRRVLRPGGRLSCAVFGTPEQNPWVTLPGRVLEVRGHVSPSGTDAPGILALAERERLRRLFTEGGFAEPQVEDVPFTWRFPDADEYWSFLMDSAGAIALVLGRLDDDERERVREQVVQAVTSFAGTGAFELQAVSVVASSS